MNIRGVKRNAAGGVDCEIDHKEFGWIPFTALDGDAAGSEILARVASGEFGALPEYAKTKAQSDAEQTAAAKTELVALDMAAIRLIREWVITQPGAPQSLKDNEAAALLARAQIVQ